MFLRNNGNKRTLCCVYSYISLIQFEESAQ